MLVIKVSRIIIILGAHRALFDTGTAFDADTAELGYIVLADRAHGAYFCAEPAVDTAVVGFRCHLEYVDGNAIAVPGGVIGTEGELTLYINRF